MSFVPSPSHYSGNFSNFFERYVGQNLPSADRVKAFDSRLRTYLTGKDPIHLLRHVSGQTRGKICLTRQGSRILPTDNAPVWWTHALLLSENPLPADESLFSAMPSHFFMMARVKTLNQEGYHAAHILPAKNGSTDWQSWTREELARRMLLNIHPCNVFLVAKQDWQLNGGRPDIIAWVTATYLRRYGSIMERFLAEVGQSVSDFQGSPNDPTYRYDSKIGHATVAQSVTTGVTLCAKRPFISHRYIGTHTRLQLTLNDMRFLIPHDDLVSWVGEHTTALLSSSWRDRGAYSWPRPSRAMQRFLAGYLESSSSLSNIR